MDGEPSTEGVTRMKDFEQFPPIEGTPSSSYLFLLAAITLGLTAIVLCIIG